MNSKHGEKEIDREQKQRPVVRELPVRIHSRELWNDRNLAENLEATYLARVVPN